MIGTGEAPAASTASAASATSTASAASAEKPEARDRADVAARFEAIGAEADALRHGAEPPAPGDLAEMASGASLVDQFLAEIAEAVRQVCVAGLAFPAPELPSTLDDLAERAAALRLATAFETLKRLRVRVAAVLAEPALEQRPALSADAWEETQRLIAWARLFQREHDLVTVQSRMAAEARGEAASASAAAVTYPSRSMTLWPLGIDLSPGGKLLVFCRDVESPAIAVLVDHLAEYRHDDPLGGKAISRLFQESLSLGTLLRNLLRLDDHPVAERGGVLFFRPAFGATPKSRPVADSFVPPALPVLALEPGAAPPLGPGRLALRLRWADGALRVRDEGGGDVPLALTPLLRFNLSKLLLREACRALPLEAIVVGRGHELRALSAQTDFDGRAFVAHDPSLFLLAREVLQARFERARPGDPLALAYARAAACFLGGASDDALDALRAGLAELAPRGLEATYRRAFAGALHNAALPAERVRPLLDDALAELAQPSPGADADLARLARVLGRDSASSADVRLLEGAAYPLVWLAMEAGLVDALRPRLQALLDGRLASVGPADPAGSAADDAAGAAASLSDVCAKALLTALLGAPLVGSTARAAGAVAGAYAGDDDDDDDDDDAPAAPKPDGAGGEGGSVERGQGGAVERAIALVRGHAEGLSAASGGSRRRELPDSLELLRLGDTLAFLSGTSRLRGTLAPLSLPVEALRQRAVDALLAASPEAGEAGPGALFAASDALLALLEAGQAHFLFR